MEKLRLALLKDTNPDKIRVLINQLKYEDIYEEFCDFLDKCEVLHIELSDPVRRFMIDFIIQYRWENLQPTAEKIICNIEGRVNLVKEILEENLHTFEDSLDDEKIHLLLFLARIMNELRFNNNYQSQRKVPWDELRFLICIFVATKTDKRHSKYPLIDCFFQFLVDEEFILNSLKKLLETLKNELWSEKWTDLKTMYTKTRYYYEMRKVHFHILHIYPKDFDEYQKNEMILIRHFQQIGESLKVIEKLGISKENTTEVPLLELYLMENIINNFISMRNTISHAKIRKGDIAHFPFVNLLKISFVKIDILILDLLNAEQMSITDTFIRNVLAEADSIKFLSKIHRIDTQELNNWEYKQNDNVITKWFADHITNNIKSAQHNGCQSILEINELNRLSKALNNLNTLNSEKFSNLVLVYFSFLKGNGVKEIQNRLKCLQKNKGQYISEQICNLHIIICIFCIYASVCLNKNYEIVKYLIEMEFIQDKSLFETSLEMAIVNGNFNLVRYLISIDTTIIGSRSVLMALYRGDFELTKLLIKHGPEPDFSLILESSFYLFCDLNVCEYLVNEYPNFINHNNFQLLFVTCLFKNEKLLIFLFEKIEHSIAIKYVKTVLNIASLYFDNVKIIEYFLEKGATIDSETKLALVYACQHSRVEIAKFLLDNGANPSLEYCHNSPLNWSIRNQSVEISEELFKRKVKIDENTVNEYIRNVKPFFF